MPDPLEKKDKRRPPEKTPGCDGRFLANRQNTLFYRSKTNGAIPRKLPCTQTATYRVPHRISIPIYWARLGHPQWTAPQAQAKLDEASRWFARYCIQLTLYPIPLRPQDGQQFGQRLQRADAQGPNDHANEARKVYKDLWARIGRPRDLQMILFVDTFRAVKYDGQRVNRVAGNFVDVPVILIPADPDRNSTHIVTHELIHGLGKLRSTSSTPPKTRVPGSGADRINTWDEGGCGEDMGNARRANPAAAMSKSDDDLLDYASYHQFLVRAKTIA